MLGISETGDRVEVNVNGQHLGPWDDRKAVGVLVVSLHCRFKRCHHWRQLSDDPALWLPSFPCMCRKTEEAGFTTDMIVLLYWSWAPLPLLILLYEKNFIF